MATVSPPIFLTLLFLFFFILSGGVLRHAKGEEHGQGWCVARPSTSEVQLQKNIKYICEEMALNCNMIQPSGPCYEPQILTNHASVVMNLFYQVNERHSWNCWFNDSGLNAIQDPSYGDCKYEYTN